MRVSSAQTSIEAGASLLRYPFGDTGGEVALPVPDVCLVSDVWDICRQQRFRNARELTPAKYPGTLAGVSDRITIEYQNRGLEGVG